MTEATNDGARKHWAAGRRLVKQQTKALDLKDRAGPIVQQQAWVHGVQVLTDACPDRADEAAQTAAEFNGPRLLAWWFGQVAREVIWDKPTPPRRGKSPARRVSGASMTGSAMVAGVLRVPISVMDSPHAGGSHGLPGVHRGEAGREGRMGGVG